MAPALKNLTSASIFPLFHADFIIFPQTASLVLAPFSIIHIQSSKFDQGDRTAKGVFPSFTGLVQALSVLVIRRLTLFLAFKSAPFSFKNLQTLKLPRRAAQWRGVSSFYTAWVRPTLTFLPRLTLSWAPRSAPFSFKYLQTSRCPHRAAKWRTVSWSCVVWVHLTSTCASFTYLASSIQINSVLLQVFTNIYLSIFGSQTKGSVSPLDAS